VFRNCVIAFGFVLAFSGTPSSAGLESDLADLKKTAETCVESGRNVCVVSTSTQVLTSSRNLEYLFAADPDLVEWYVRIFQRASFEVAKEGRPVFRKFLTENATWALDFHSELRKFLGKRPLGQRQKEIAFAGYDLLRADACHTIKVEHCAVAATRGVYNAQKRQYWDMVVERFEMEEPFVSQMPTRMIDLYKDQL
jgi:hypothetical protein